MSRQDAARGTLLGLACGDALGRPVEFESARSIRETHGTVREMLGDGSHRQPPGTVTDDTDMALAIARSLDERGRFDPADVADRFVEWYRSGPFDVGLLTVDAISELADGVPWNRAGATVYADRAEGNNAGNGSVMRCAPLALAFADDPDALAAASRQSSSITHHDPRCREGCAVLNLTIAGYLNGVDRPLGAALDHVGEEMPDELADALRVVPDGLAPADLATSGYVVTTLQTALYHALTAESAEAAIVDAVNGGGDADTIAAVAGAVAGARFGADALPDRWVAALSGVDPDELRRLADSLVGREFGD